MDDAQKIGCAIGKDKHTKLIVRCIMNRPNGLDASDKLKKFYSVGEPCSQCHQINAFCDSHYKNLCSMFLSILHI